MKIKRRAGFSATNQVKARLHQTELLNALGVLTGQAFDTNQFDFTTNYFQAYDVPLTNGLNVLTLHATDLAGNVATLTTNINYVPATNPPAANLVWPQDGMQISGNSLTFQGRVDDPTATVTVSVVDANGNTNSLNGRTGRDGNFWIENVPLNAGTNLLTVAVANAGGVSTTTLNLYQSSVNLTINAVAAGDTNVTCSIDTDGYTVWVNGNEAADNGDGTWTAQITPIGIGGGLVIAEAIPDGNSFNSSRWMAAQTSEQAPDIYAEVTVQPPQGVFISQYFSHSQTNSGIWWNFGIDDVEWMPESWHDNLDWRDGGGGHEEIYESEFYGQWMIGADELGWPTNNWPTALPDGSGYTVGGGTTNPVTVWLPALAMEHCDTSKIDFYDDGGTNSYRRTVDTEMRLVTGGRLGSTQKNLWCISATATDTKTGLPVPYTQIKIGKLGNLGTDGKLNVLLADGDPVVTPTAAGNDNYTFTKPSTNEYPLAITANGITLSNGVVASGANFCVGQNVSFALTGLPTDGSIIATNFQWTLGGTFVNTNTPSQYSDGCQDYYIEDTNYLKLPSTWAWWVSGGYSPITYQASVTCDLISTNGNKLINVSASGEFTMHRPRLNYSLVHSPLMSIYHGHLPGADPSFADLLGCARSPNAPEYYVKIDSAFGGAGGITQLGNGIATNECPEFHSTGASNQLDTAEFPDSDIVGTNLNWKVSVVAGNPAVSKLHFGDGQNIQCIGHTIDSFEFVDFIRFQPSGGIYVTLGTVSWGLHGTSDFSSTINDNVTNSGSSQHIDSTPSTSNQFPQWDAIMTGTPNKTSCP